MRTSASRIALLYAALTGLWIFAVDVAVDVLVIDPRGFAGLHLAHAVASVFLLYVLLGRDLRGRERAEAALRQAHAELELRVRERTAELAEVNQALQLEVTLHRQTEEALRQSERRFRSIVENSDDGIVLVDEQGLIVEWNPAQERITGLSRSEAVGRASWDIRFQTTPDEQRSPAVYEALKAGTLKTLQIGQADQLGRFQERTIQRPDGTRCEVHSLISPIRTNRGFMMASFARNITERKRAEQERGRLIAELEGAQRQAVASATETQLANSLLHALIDTMPAGVLVANADGAMVLANPAARAILGGAVTGTAFGPRGGYTLHRVDGSPFPAEDLPLPRAIQRDETTRGIEALIRREDGAEVSILIAASPVQDAAGSIISGVAVFQDITDQKRMEQALQESEQTARALMNASPESALLLDAWGVVLAANEIAANRLRTTAHQLVGASVYDFLPPEVADRRKTHLEQAVRTGRPVRFEDERAGLWFDNHLHPIFDAEGKVVRLAVFGQDITDRRRKEEALQRALEESQQRQTEITALLAGARAVMAHREFPDAARAIFDVCKEVIGAAAGYVSLLSEDAARNEVVFLDAGQQACSVDPSLPMPVRGLREQALRTGQTVYDNNFPASAWTRFIPEGHANLDHVLFAPLIIEGQPVGLLGLANKPGGFTDNDARMATAFGELAAIALRNSQVLESLENSEERFRSVAQTAHDAIVTVDDSGTVVFCNRAAESMFGFPADEMAGRSFSMIMPARFRAACETGIRRAMATGKSVHAGRIIEAAGLRKNGSEFPLEHSFAAWQTSEGIFFTATLRDITERKQAEAQLEQLLAQVQQERERVAALALQLQAERDTLDVIMENTRAHLAYLDPQFNFIRVNSTYAEGSGHTIAELLGRNHFGFFPHPENQTIFERVRDTGQPVEFRAKPFEFVDQPERGVTYWDWTLVPVKAADGEVQGLVLSLLDVTESKRAEQQAQRLVMLEERQHLARELHDSLSQALYGIALGAHTALTYLDSDRGKVTEALDYVLSLTDAGLTEMRALIFELRPESLQIEGLVSALAKQAAAVRARYDIPVDTDLCTEPDVPIETKETLYRIAQEALHNAVKHAHASRLNVRLCCGDGGVVLEVSDDGVGFDPTQLHAGHLGLRSMRERAARLGGKLDVHSAPGNGARIRAQMPSHLPSAA